MTKLIVGAAIDFGNPSLVNGPHLSIRSADELSQVLYRSLGFGGLS